RVWRIVELDVLDLDRRVAAVGGKRGHVDLHEAVIGLAGGVAELEGHESELAGEIAVEVDGRGLAIDVAGTGRRLWRGVTDAEAFDGDGGVAGLVDECGVVLSQPDEVAVAGVIDEAVEECAELFGRGLGALGEKAFENLPAYDRRLHGRWRENGC